MKKASILILPLTLLIVFLVVTPSFAETIRNVIWSNTCSDPYVLEQDQETGLVECVEYIEVTSTPEPDTATPTATLETPTATLSVPTETATITPIPPTETPVITTISPTETFTLTPLPPTVGSTPISPTETPTITLPPPTETPTPTLPPTPTSIIVNHLSLPLYDQIPDTVKQEAQQLVFQFSDRSVGGNINEGIICLSASTWSASPSYCRRYYIDETLTNWKTFSLRDANIPEIILFPGGDSRENITYFYDSADYPEAGFELFINIINAAPSGSVVTYMPNYFEVDESKIIDGLFVAGPGTDIYDIFEAEDARPDITVVYSTTNLSRVIGTAQSTEYNQNMRTVVTAEGRILFDVADIESHTPEGLECKLDDYPIICQEYTTEQAGGHLGSVSAGKIQLAKAIWVLLAQISGWEPVVVPSPTPTLTPEPTTVIPTETATPTLEP